MKRLVFPASLSVIEATRSQKTNPENHEKVINCTHPSCPVRAALWTRGELVSAVGVSLSSSCGLNDSGDVSIWTVGHAGLFPALLGNDVPTIYRELCNYFLPEYDACRHLSRTVFLAHFYSVLGPIHGSLMCLMAVDKQHPLKVTSTM